MIAKPFIEVLGSVFIGLVLGFILSKLANIMDKSRDDLQILSITSILLAIGIIYLLNRWLQQYAISLSSLLACITLGTMVANLVKKQIKLSLVLTTLQLHFM